MRYYHLFFGLLGLSAILDRFIFSLSSLGSLIIFFSYFTMLSNIMAVGLFFYLGYIKKPLRNIDSIRGAIVLYMCVTGLVVYFILSKYPLTIPIWVNAIVHQIMPVAVFAEWIIVPIQKKLKFTLAFYWLLFPIVFALYSLIHGRFINWYPYPFLNPAFGGYQQVFINIGLLLLFAYILGLSLITIANFRRK